LHAFLDLYTCRKWCCRHKKRSSGDWGFTGEGHRAVWCNAMIMIQEKFEGLVGWPADMGIAIAVMSEMQDDDEDWQPREEQLRRWGLWGERQMNDKFERETSFLRSEWPDARGHRHRHSEDDEDDENTVVGDSWGGDRHRYSHHRHQDDSDEEEEVEYVRVCCAVM